MHRIAASRGTPRNGEGAAIVALVLVLALATLALALSPLADSGKKDATAAALGLARAALVGRAVADANRPGSLPCPDFATDIPGSNVPGDGIADLLAGSQCPSYVGWLPWRTLDLPELRDSAGARLWYALSPNLRDHASAQPINSDTPGLLVLDGDGNAAALVIAPGSPLAGQSRSGAPRSADYLEGANADGDLVFSASAGNDRVLALGRDELMRAVETRVAREALRSLLAYYCGGAAQVAADGRCLGSGGARHFPGAADIADTSCLGAAALAPGACIATTQRHGRIPANPDPPWSAYDANSPLSGNAAAPNDWFQRNAWREVVLYAVSAACAQGTTNCGGGAWLEIAALTGSAAARVLTLAAGPAQGALGQARGTLAAKGLWPNYAEGENATPGDDRYALQPAAGNDRIAWQP